MLYTLDFWLLSVCSWLALSAEPNPIEFLKYYALEKKSAILQKSTIKGITYDIDNVLVVRLCCKNQSFAPKLHCMIPVVAKSILWVSSFLSLVSCFEKDLKN